MTDQQIYLPRTMDQWPWGRAINPHYREISAQSNAWFHGLKAFTNGSQMAFDKCDFGRLASLAYPTVSKEHLRIGCDFMNLNFVIDEYTDVEPAPVVREMVDIVIDALNNPHKLRPEGEVILGRVAKEFWELAIKTVSPTSQRHFIESFNDYLNSVVRQAQDRDSKTALTVESYFEMRRQNIGTRPSFAVGEFHLNLPDEVFYHPVIKELEYFITDLVILDNDIASYNKEQSVGGDKHNIITIIMHQLNTDIQGAMEWAAEYHKDIEALFLDGLKRVPLFGRNVNTELQEYIKHLANWPRCNDCWNFESGRYFGSKGILFQQTRCIPLLPKAEVNHMLKRDQVVIPLVPL